MCVGVFSEHADDALWRLCVCVSPGVNECVMHDSNV